jgi:membrane-associated phospholipid phosphatase
MLRRAALVSLAILAACQPAAPNPQLVSQWVRAAMNAAQSAQLDAPVAARVSAYASIALFEGYAADPRSNLRSLAGQLNGLWSIPLVEVARPVDGATVAAEATRVVLGSLFEKGAPPIRAAFDSLAATQFQDRRRARVRDVVRERSVQHGRALGTAIVAWSSGDGFLATRSRPWRAAAGESKWAHAKGDMPTEPHWGALRTFATRNGDECAPPPPPAYSVRVGSEFWKMGKESFDSARALGDAQRAVVAFWSDSAQAAAPGMRWLTLLSQLASRRREPADRAAEMHMLAAVAVADAFIGVRREQFRSLVVRPATYASRVFDRRWSPPSPTPPLPAYPSSHAALSSAATTVLAHFFGGNTAYTESSQVAVGAASRDFRSFSAAAEEVAMSQVYGGVDYLLAATNGGAQGRCVAERVLGRLRTR